MEKCNWEKCNGEAHRNPYIDNCLSCAPFWGEYPVCPTHQQPLRLSRSYKSGLCPCCLKRFKVERASSFVELFPGCSVAVMGGGRG